MIVTADARCPTKCKLGCKTWCGTSFLLLFFFCSINSSVVHCLFIDRATPSRPSPSLGGFVH
jgi:hypothetical protein